MKDKAGSNFLKLCDNMEHDCLSSQATSSMQIRIARHSRGGSVEGGGGGVDSSRPSHLKS